MPHLPVLNVLSSYEGEHKLISYSWEPQQLHTTPSDEFQARVQTCCPSCPSSYQSF